MIVLLVKYGFKEADVVDGMPFKRMKAYYASCCKMEQQSMKQMITGNRVAYHADEKVFKDIMKDL